MKLNIQFVQTAQRTEIEKLVTDKLEYLSQKFEWIIGADVFLKEEKDTYGKGKICDIRLSLPGPRIFASSDEESFEAAVGETIRDLEIQLKKRKAEMQSY
jgi:ribosomal subunit interface protein